MPTRRLACVRVPKRCKPCCRRSPRADDRNFERSTMRRPQRLIAAAVLIALCSALAGCGSNFGSGFDPTARLACLETKKKLPGEPKPVFPEGVPGLEQGVPKDLYKGAQQQQDVPPVAQQPPPPEPKQV